MATEIKRYPSLSHWGAFTAVVENGRLIDCEPFAFDSAPSAILKSMPGSIHSSLRVARPAVRRGWLKDRERSDRSQRGDDSFVEVSWDTALKLVADELARVRADYGHDAIFGGSYGWSSAGRLHHARTLTHRFLNAGGGCVNQVGNYSWGAAQFLLPHVIGTYAPVTGRVTDWKNVQEHTELFMAFGGLPLRNTQITSGGAGEHSAERWVQAASDKGVKFVVISPHRSDIPAGITADWIAIRPNTDTAMMMAMIHTLIAAGLHDSHFVNTYCAGFEPFAAYVNGESDGQPKTCEWAAAICGVPADTIRGLALQAARHRTYITCAWSLQRAHHGEQPYWASIALAAVLGQIGLPGGGFAFGHGSMNGVGNPRPSVPAPEMSSGRNPINRAIPVARFTDMLLSPGEAFQFNGEGDVYPDIQMIYWAGGNPFHHQQDLNRLVRAWQKPETVIVHENWWTPTARRADIVLPATVTLERNDIGGSSRDRFVLASKQALQPYGQSRNDFDIYRELSALAGHENAFTEGRDEQQWIRFIYEGMAQKWAQAGFNSPPFEEFWDAGYIQLPEPEKDFILFQEFREDPKGQALKTPSGKIELFSNHIAQFGYADCPPHPAWLPPIEWLGAAQAEKWPLHLITFQPPDKLHSQMDAGATSLKNKTEGRARLYIGVAEAGQRGIHDNDILRVFNDRGSCIAAAVVDSGMAPGVVAMPTGAWFDPQDDQLERHGNPNVLTVDIGTSQLTQGSSAQSALVQVERWNQGALPEVQAFVVPV
ncbi:MAG TPA: molybdopterin-dependent oxidoreductase [Eoetvoesiella sp.]